jgi:pyruvate/2-oxoglutarate dehydrogenase complex dihydrolipoamide dehydrogenase (E3) component
MPSDTNNLAGANRTTRGRVVPCCVFADPHLSRVGLSEREALQQGIAVRFAKSPTNAVLRTRTTAEKEGLMKAVFADDDRILSGLSP